MIYSKAGAAAGAGVAAGKPAALHMDDEGAGMTAIRQMRRDPARPKDKRSAGDLK